MPLMNNTVAHSEASLNTLETITDNNSQKQVHVLFVEDDMLAQKTSVYNLNKWGIEAGKVLNQSYWVIGRYAQSVR